VTAAPSNGAFGTRFAGTTVSVNGFAAPIFYTSAIQVNAILPYEVSGITANVIVAYTGEISPAVAGKNYTLGRQKQLPNRQESAKPFGSSGPAHWQNVCTLSIARFRAMPNEGD
jgi:hypothetical protein